MNTDRRLQVAVTGVGWFDVAGAGWEDLLRSRMCLSVFIGGSKFWPASTRLVPIALSAPARSMDDQAAVVISRPRMSTTPEQSEDFAQLYRQAFAAFSVRALWNKRELDAPTAEDALVIAHALRVEGNREARVPAERIEAACRAAH
jgi:hypothetical protein